MNPPPCPHRLDNGLSARSGALFSCNVCGKHPAILGVLPFTKAEQAVLDARKAERAAKVTA